METTWTEIMKLKKIIILIHFLPSQTHVIANMEENVFLNPKPVTAVTGSQVQNVKRESGKFYLWED